MRRTLQTRARALCEEGRLERRRRGGERGEHATLARHEGGDHKPAASSTAAATATVKLQGGGERRAEGAARDARPSREEPQLPLPHRVGRRPAALRERAGEGRCAGSAAGRGGGGSGAGTGSCAGFHHRLAVGGC